MTVKCPMYYVFMNSIIVFVCLYILKHKAVYIYLFVFPELIEETGRFCLFRTEVRHLCSQTFVYRNSQPCYRAGYLIN